MEITNVMKAASDVMENCLMYYPFLKVEYLDSPQRGSVSESYPIGSLMVKTKLTLNWFDKTFVYVVGIQYSMLEDMCIPMGELIAQEFLWPIFKEDITKSGIYADLLASEILKADINKWENENTDTNNS